MAGLTMDADFASSEAPAVLLLGYGNTLRQDDGVGPRVVTRVGDFGLPGVRTVVGAQLSPEHAELVAAAGVVVFVDAQLDYKGPVRLQPVLPADSAQALTHALEPGTLLALAREVYGRVPRGWLLVIPARQVGFGEDLSSEAATGAAMALRLLDHFIHLRLAARPARASTARA